MAITSNQQLVARAKKMVEAQKALIDEATELLKNESLSNEKKATLLDIISRAQSAIEILEANIKARS